MDLHKLTYNEIIESLGFNLNYNTDIYEQAAILFKNISPGQSYPIPIADLYIAESLYKSGIVLPKNYDSNELPSDLFLQLTKTYYLPNEDTPENRIRASRITRIILDIINDNEKLIAQQNPIKQSPIKQFPSPNEQFLSPVKQFLSPVKQFPSPVKQFPSPIKQLYSPRKSQGKNPLDWIKITPFIFYGTGIVGDFNWMIKQPEYKGTLFLFNDNQEQFQKFAEYTITHSENDKNLACSSGGGNAIIRPYQCLDPPRAAGIPTGVNGLGYKNLNTAKPYIDASTQYIKALLNTGLYDSIAYSSEYDGRTLGTSIYSPSNDVKEYIVQSLENIVK